jgi:HK97 family phage major capsid protein
MNFQKRLEKLQAEFRAAEDRGLLILATAKKEGRDLTARETADADKSADQCLQLKGSINELRAIAKEQGDYFEGGAPGVADRIPVDGNGGADGTSFTAAAHRYVPKIGAVKYADLFGTPRADENFPTMREFLQAVEGNDLSKLRRFRDAPKAVAIRSGVNETVPAEGGFLIGEELWSRVWDRALEDMLVLPRALVFPMKGPTLRVPGFDDRDRSSTLFGGLVGQILAEGADATPVNPKFRSMILTAIKYGIYARASSEFNEDVLGGNPIDMSLPRALAWFMDWFFINGSGAGQPLGILNAGATITVAKETGQTADTINYANVAKMYQKNSARDRSVWIANTTTLPQLLQLCIPMGISGQAVPVLSQIGGLAMLTRPVILTEKLPVLGDAGDLMFCDLSQYMVGVRREATVERTNLVSWTSDQIDWRILARFDGQPGVEAAATRKDATTESPFIILGARA